MATPLPAIFSESPIEEGTTSSRTPLPDIFKDESAPEQEATPTPLHTGVKSFGAGVVPAAASIAGMGAGVVAAGNALRQLPSW